MSWPVVLLPDFEIPVETLVDTIAVAGDDTAVLLGVDTYWHNLMKTVIWREKKILELKPPRH